MHHVVPKWSIEETKSSTLRVAVQVVLVHIRFSVKHRSFSDWKSTSGLLFIPKCCSPFVFWKGLIGEVQMIFSYPEWARYTSSLLLISHRGIQVRRSFFLIPHLSYNSDNPSRLHLTLKKGMSSSSDWKKYLFLFLLLAIKVYISLPVLLNQEVQRGIYFPFDDCEVAERVKFNMTTVAYSVSTFHNVSLLFHAPLLLLWLLYSCHSRKQK